jgi:CheY-like chemotaxis protein
MVDGLQDLRILVVEDEFFVAMDLKRLVEAAGGVVVGPTGALTRAHELAQGDIDAAILDVRLDGETSASVAEELRQRHKPFLLVTGYEAQTLPPSLADAPRLGKPFSDHAFFAAAQHLR